MGRGVPVRMLPSVPGEVGGGERQRKPPSHYNADMAKQAAMLVNNTPTFGSKTSVSNWKE